MIYRRTTTWCTLHGFAMAWFVIATLVATTAPLRAQEIRRFQLRAKQGLHLAVRVSDYALVHTTQFLGSKSADEPSVVIRQLSAELKKHRATPKDLVKLNVYVTSLDARKQFVASLRKWLNEAKARPPAVSFVTTPLPGGVALAVDGIFAVDSDERSVIRFSRQEPFALSALLPKGDVVYVSGQAEPGDLAQATRATMQGLLRTLKHMRLSPNDIVRIKCFLKPMKDVATVTREIRSALPSGLLPPISHVEWIAGSRPIEIELVARAPSQPATSSVTYLTPPWMKSSPVFSRVSRIHGNDRIYVAGLYAQQPSKGSEQTSQIFGTLRSVLAEAGSDLKHMSKATYYVSEAETSAALNKLRPTLFDPRRPPAASKAMVGDVGADKRTITIDMIAAPLKK